MGIKVWTGKGGVSVADPNNWEHVRTTQFNSVDDEGVMVENLNEQQIKCPKCLGVWPIRSEQAAAVCKHGKCVCCLIDDKEDFEPSHMRVIEPSNESVVDPKKGVTTRAQAESEHASPLKDLAGAAEAVQLRGHHNGLDLHMSERELQADRVAASLGFAADELDAFREPVKATGAIMPRLKACTVTERNGNYSSR